MSAEMGLLRKLSSSDLNHRVELAAEVHHLSRYFHKCYHFYSLHYVQSRPLLSEHGHFQGKDQGFGLHVGNSIFQGVSH